MGKHWKDVLRFHLKHLGCSSSRSQDSHFNDFVDKQTKYTTKCMVTAPVMSGKEPVGVIMALNKQGAEQFSKSDQEVTKLVNPTFSGLAYYDSS